MCIRKDSMCSNASITSPSSASTWISCVFRSASTTVSTARPIISMMRRWKGWISLIEDMSLIEDANSNWTRTGYNTPFHTIDFHRTTKLHIFRIFEASLTLVSRTFIKIYCAQWTSTRTSGFSRAMNDIFCCIISHLQTSLSSIPPFRARRGSRLLDGLL